MAASHVASAVPPASSVRSASSYSASTVSGNPSSSSGRTAIRGLWTPVTTPFSTLMVVGPDRVHSHEYVTRHS